VLRLLGRDGLGEQRRTVRQLVRQDGVTYRPTAAATSRPGVWTGTTAAGRGGMATPRAGARATGGIARPDPGRPLRAPPTAGRGPHPAEIVLGHSGFVARRRPDPVARARQLFIAAATSPAGRTGSGRCWATDPGAVGTGYAMANRRVISRSLPGLYRDTRIHRIGPFFQADAGRVAGAGAVAAEDARVVLLTSGAKRDRVRPGLPVHAARLPLVEGNDLHRPRRAAVGSGPSDASNPSTSSCAGSTPGSADPLELRPDSHLGVPGLVAAARLGNVSWSTARHRCAGDPGCTHSCPGSPRCCSGRSYSCVRRNLVVRRPGR